MRIIKPITILKSGVLMPLPVCKIKKESGKSGSN
jgi:hypothetical protein